MRGIAVIYGLRKAVFFLLDCVCFFICFLAWLILGVVVTPDQCRGGGRGHRQCNLICPFSEYLMAKLWFLVIAVVCYCFVVELFSALIFTVVLLMIN